MKNNKGNAGRSTRQMQRDRLLQQLIMVVILLVVGMGCVMLIPALGKGGFGSLPILLILVIGFRFFSGFMSRRSRELGGMERRAARGAAAEEQMGAMFDLLGNDVEVYHDVPTDHGNIDHLILSKTKGLIVVETKSHHGRITVSDQRLLLNGHPTEKDFINQTLGSCYWVRDWLKTNLGIEPWVHGVVVFTNAFVDMRGKIKGVSVINKGYFTQWMDRQPHDPNADVLWATRPALRMLISPPTGGGK